MIKYSKNHTHIKNLKVHNVLTKYSTNVFYKPGCFALPKSFNIPNNKYAINSKSINNTHTTLQNQNTLSLKPDLKYRIVDLAFVNLCTSQDMQLTIGCGFAQHKTNSKKIFKKFTQITSFKKGLYNFVKVKNNRLNSFVLHKRHVLSHYSLLNNTQTRLTKIYGFLSTNTYKTYIGAALIKAYTNTESNKFQSNDTVNILYDEKASKKLNVISKNQKKSIEFSQYQKKQNFKFAKRTTLFFVALLENKNSILFNKALFL